jgi:integrase
MGLGSAATVTLAQAREAAGEARLQLAQGHDPLATKIIAQKIPTFGEMADEVIAVLAPAWRNPKHRDQWVMTLETYCAPIRALRVDAVTTEHVCTILRPLWSKVPETASRLRGRIEKVLDAAKAKGHRQGENPARWRGHLDHLLPARRKLTRGHHKALPYDQVPKFVRRLDDLGSISAVCLEFVILTAARSGEAMGARWEEIDLETGTWIVPAKRMKAGREHRVPLSPRAIEILQLVEKVRASDLVFPGQRQGRPLSTMALEMLLRRMKVDVTVHGFRSAFRDWAAEQSSLPREVAEAALAHTLDNKIEAAYRRTDFFFKRRELMNEWSKFVAA